MGKLQWEFGHCLNRYITRDGVIPNSESYNFQNLFTYVTYMPFAFQVAGVMALSLLNIALGSCFPVERERVIFAFLFAVYISLLLKTNC